MAQMMRLVTVLTICSIVFHSISNLGGVDGAQGLYVFGDSYTDTGASLSAPYGITWPGVDGMRNRWSDGFNEADYFATLFEVPTLTPFAHLDASNTKNGGVNFGVGGAGVGVGLQLSVQVDRFEKLVNANLWTTEHLQPFQHQWWHCPVGSRVFKLVTQGVSGSLLRPLLANTKGVAALTTSEVDGIALNVRRVLNLGIRHIMVASLAPQTCMPLYTLKANNSTACITNDMFSTETAQHNALLENRIQLLNDGIPGSKIIIIHMTKALEELFHNGEKYGFVDPYKQCCVGDCGNSNTAMWTVCEDPSKSVIFDTIHPTQAGWRAVVDLYTNGDGYTVLGPNLSAWKSKHNL